MNNGPALKVFKNEGQRPMEAEVSKGIQMDCTIATATGVRGFKTYPFPSYQISITILGRIWD